MLTTQNLETDATNPPGLPFLCLALLVLRGAMADSLRKGFNPECVARHRQEGQREQQIERPRKKLVSLVMDPSLPGAAGTAG